jgi:hypothetical protein
MATTFTRTEIEKGILQSLHHGFQQKEKSPFSFVDAASDFAKRHTFNADTARLLLLNSLRYFRIYLAYPEVFGHHLLWIDALIQHVGPVLTLAGFLIYIPRSVLSSITLYQALTAHPDIPLKARLYALYEKDDRLFNLINDFPSVLSGFISVFILTATTAWLAAYITVAVKLWEVIFAAIKCHLDVSRLQNMRVACHFETPTDSERAYLKHLDEHIAYTREIRNITFMMHALLLPCLASFTPHIMMLHPAIPILATTFAITLVCLRFPAFRDLWMNAPEPEEKKLQPLSFFQTSPIDKDDPPCLDLKYI